MIEGVSLHQFPITVLNQVALIRAPQQLTKQEAAEFATACTQICQQHPLPSRLVIDFSRTTFMDSSGLGALVRTLRQTRQVGLELVLWSVADQVMMVLSLSTLDKQFIIDPGTQAISPTLDHSSPHPALSTHPSVRSRIKRGIDIVGAIVGLGITGLLFIPVAFAICLDSPGPIFFSQVRCGLMGRRFRLWKFRSMVVNAEALKSQIYNQAQGSFFKNANDPRVTRVGRWLRRTSLDELPQFWNVLMGDMSLVGTRPPLPQELETYDIPEWRRLDVKPGITGEWQVSGRSKIKQFEDVVRLDLKYQQNWSLMYDFKLILKTIQVIFTKNSGAY
jgi:anti-anti-sigma factor